MKLNQVIIPLCLSMVAVHPAFAAKKSIYGLDGRKDVNKSSEVKITQWKQAVAGMVAKDELTLQNGAYTFKGTSLHEASGLSLDQLFAEQNSLPSCTGFLVAPGLLMTAGHCIQNVKDCTDNYWVFDYDDSAAKNQSIDASNVATCKRVISQKFEGSHWVPTRDYALVELNWNEQLDTRIPVELDESLNVGDHLAVLGHPVGLPLKITTGALAMRINDTTFNAPLDTFGGNSGSPVFNRETGKVIGMLIAGREDFTEEENGRVVYTHYPMDTPVEEMEEILKISATPVIEIANNFAVGEQLNGNVNVLHQSILDNDYQVFKEILNLESNDQSADVLNAKDNAFDVTPLIYAINLGRTEMIRDLINNELVDVNVHDRNYDSALGLIISSLEDIDLALLAIEKGADVTWENGFGDSIETLADYSGISEIIDAVSERLNQK